MNIENLTREELIELHFATAEKLGWYSVMTLCVEDVEAHLKSAEIEPMPSRDDIQAACEYVARKSDMMNDISYIFDLAVEQAIENAEEQA